MRSSILLLTSSRTLYIAAYNIFSESKLAMSYLTKQPLLSHIICVYTICDWICEKGSYTRNYKYLEIQF